MTKNKYTKKEMAALVKAIMAMDKVSAICIDMDEDESVVRFEKTSAGSFVMKLLSSVCACSADYDVNAGTLLEYDVRKNCVYLRLKEEYGDSVSFWLQFMQPMKPIGFPGQDDSKKEKRNGTK